MKQFFGAFFGSLVGLIVATLLGVFIIVAVIKTSFSEALREKEGVVVVKNNSVLKVTLDGAIVDREVENPFAHVKGLKEFSNDNGIGLNTTLKKIQHAATDENIKGIYLDLKKLDAGYANITELRDALIAFKKSGKFIYAYSELYGQKEYYLASAASKVFINPQGAMEFKGLNMSLMFYKNALAKLGVEVQIFRHGKFKSAVEPFLLDKMSEANRLQSETFLNSIWNTLLDGISTERKLSKEDLNSWADNLSIQEPEEAKGKLVDAISYEDEVHSEIRKKLGLTEKDKINFVGLDKYSSKDKAVTKIKGNHIAVIYASGNIASGEGSNDEIGSEGLVKAIREARLDEKVKAIVLRVNSPGGSALASEVIWREVMLAKKIKPFVVSMGNLAASGGYYISCGADRIFAQPNTITGSIGVFGMIPNLQKAFEEKLGITIDTVNTNKHSHIGTALLPVTGKEYDHIQRSVEKIYGVFTSRVAEGRGMDINAVDSIGQGRVWTGADALKLKLVDELGGLNDAIAFAAKKAKTSDYKIIELPKQKNPFAEFLGDAEMEAESRIMKKNIGGAYKYFSYLESLLEMKGVQARLPFEMIIQ